ncbi:hypothetical protein [Pseudomonas amygdali]|uniref:hypothetical protein n=1 Tax=Pseudomonas amygdali TaxID=47877 RepID=UPI000EFE59D7|nr:hypothetical protein [Pseudomonas amygdali]
MSVDSIDFLSWAESEISGVETLEFAYRNASSRAYYALYHSAKNRLSEMGVPIVRVANGGSHAALISTVRSMGRSGAVLAESMDRLKKFRHMCDYEISLDLDVKRAEKQIAEARRLIGMVTRL